MKPYMKRKVFWKAWGMVQLAKVVGLPFYRYSWWYHRLNLIKRNEI